MAERIASDDRPSGAIRLALFGSPITHSLSPLIHQQFGLETGLNIDYTARESDVESFAADLRAFAAQGGRGCNITVPFKLQAFKLAQKVTPLAARATAANTIVFDRRDQWTAHNTDGPGLMADLDRNQVFCLQGTRVCLIGAGGAAAGVLYTLLCAGPSELVIANRSADKAATLAARHSAYGRVSAIELGAIQDSGPFDLLINATALGHDGQAHDIQPGWLTDDGLVYDLNYDAAAAPLRRHCEHRSMRYCDGLGMLVEQAALSFALWTGVAPHTGDVLAKLRAQRM